MDQNQFTITQVSEILGIKDSTLRKWENDYDLKIPRNELGHRFYTTKEIEVLKNIKKMKDEGANIHVIKRIMERSVDVTEQKEQALELLTLDKLTAAELKEVMTRHIMEMIAQREEELTRQYEEKIEHIKEEIIAELKQNFDRQQEQQSAENNKLIDYLHKIREDTTINTPWWKFWVKRKR